MALIRHRRGRCAKVMSTGQHSFYTCMNPSTGDDVQGYRLCRVHRAQYANGTPLTVTNRQYDEVAKQWSIETISL
jgi:hypothetical protein